MMSVWAGVVMMSRWLLGSFPALGWRERVLTEVWGSCVARDALVESVVRDATCGLLDLSGTRRSAW